MIFVRFSWLASSHRFCLHSGVGCHRKVRFHWESLEGVSDILDICGETAGRGKHWVV